MYVLAFGGPVYEPEWLVTQRLRTVGRTGREEDVASSEEEDTGSEHDQQGAPYSLSVGRFCCVRIMLYHAMTHFKWRVTQRLKREVEGVSPSEVWQAYCIQSACTSALCVTAVVNCSGNNESSTNKKSERLRHSCQNP